MPSTTFFHLPAEKRERLLAAARAEFVRVPYEDASINRMIREAGIPRGSFYMYFTDKEDLFHYLMESYGQQLVEQVEDGWTGTAAICFRPFWTCLTICRPTGTATASGRWRPSSAAISGSSRD